jgi:hypothetical protein
MEYIDGIEYNDRFISDRAIDVLDTLAYLQLVGSYDVRNRIIFEYNDLDNIRNWVYLRNGVDNNECEHRKYRVDTDDITKDIVHLLLKIDRNIFDLVIGEFNIEEEKKYYGFRYPIYAKCYYWDERGEKIRDENFIQVVCDTRIWNGFVKIKRHRGLALEDIFKIAVVRFLEKRYDLCLQELRSENSAYNKEWVME